MTLIMIIWMSMTMDTMTTDTENMDMNSNTFTIKTMISTTISIMSKDTIMDTKSTITMEDTDT